MLKARLYPASAFFAKAGVRVRARICSFVLMLLLCISTSPALSMRWVEDLKSANAAGLVFAYKVTADLIFTAMQGTVLAFAIASQNELHQGTHLLMLNSTHLDEPNFEACRQLVHGLDSAFDEDPFGSKVDAPHSNSSDCNALTQRSEDLMRYIDGGAYLMMVTLAAQGLTLSLAALKIIHTIFEDCKCIDIVHKRLYPFSLQGAAMAFFGSFASGVVWVAFSLNYPDWFFMNQHAWLKFVFPCSLFIQIFAIYLNFKSVKSELQLRNAY